MENNFIVGKIYEARSICDHDCIYKATVLKKTAKTVTIKTMGETVRRKIHVNAEGEQYFYPHGIYSMSPIMRA